MNEKAKTAETTPDFNVSVQGRHVQVTDAMKDYVLEKLSKLERFSTRIIDATVTMDIQRMEHRVDIILNFNNIIVKVHASTDNMYASIDKAIDKLQAKIRRYKEKLQNHQSIGHSEIAMNVNVLKTRAEDEINDEIEQQNFISDQKRYHSHEVVRKETRALKTLTQEEAVMKIELSGDQFLIYRSEEDRKIKVIYRMKDENLGIIEVE